MCTFYNIWIGLMHEHQRSDRNKYINVTDKRNSIFRLFSGFLEFARFPSCIAKKYGDYDYYSVMHYGEDNFDFETLQSKGPKETINGVECDIGHMEGLSVRDVESIKKLYGK